MPSLSLTNRWAVLALMFFVRLTIPLHFQSIAAVAPFLIAELGFSYSMIGLLMGLYMLPGILLTIPGSMLGERFGQKPVMLVSIALMMGGTLGSVFFTGLGAMIALRLAGGVGAVVLNTQTNKVVTDRFAGRELATAMAIAASAFGLGIGIATGSLGGLAELTSWRTALVVTICITAAMMGLMMGLYRDEYPAGPAEAEKREDAPAGKSPLWNLTRQETTLMAVAGLTQSGFVVGYILFMTFAPVLLIERGAPISAAGALVGVAALVAIFSVPLGGMLTDRIGKYGDLLVAGCAAGTALSCALFSFTGPALLWVMLFGLIRGGCTGGILSLPGQVLRPESRGAGMSVFFTVHYIALAVLPPLGGWLRDSAGAAWAVMLAAATWLSIVGSLAVFRMVQRHFALSSPALPAER